MKKEVPDKKEPRNERNDQRGGVEGLGIYNLTGFESRNTTKKG